MEENISKMEIFMYIVYTIIGFGLVGYLIWMLRQVPKLLEKQGIVFDEALASFERRGLKADKIVKIHLPSSRIYLNPSWVPAVYCFIFVDYKRKKWTISYNQEREPKIYDFKDFRSINLDVNGKSAGNAGLNALIAAFIGGGFGAGIGPSWDAPDGNRYTAYRNTGSIIGAGIGALFAAALTRRYGLLKRIEMKLRLSNQTITLPIVKAPLRGFRDTDKGLEYITDFISRTNDAFNYISLHS